MRYGLALLLCCGMATAAWAGTITFNLGGTTVTRTTTATQDTKITRLLAKENALRAARTPPDTALTAEQFLDQLFVAALVGYGQQADAADAGDFCASFKAASGGVRTQITTALSLPAGTSPCP